MVLHILSFIATNKNEVIFQLDLLSLLYLWITVLVQIEKIRKIWKAIDLYSKQCIFIYLHIGLLNWEFFQRVNILGYYLILSSYFLLDLCIIFSFFPLLKYYRFLTIYFNMKCFIIIICTFPIKVPNT